MKDEVHIRTCCDCRYFKHQAEELERLLPGLKSLGSAYSSVRGDAGICMHEQTYLFPQKACTQFVKL